MTVLAASRLAVLVLFSSQSGVPAVFLTIEHLNRLARHDGGDGVLVNELRVSVTAPPEVGDRPEGRPTVQSVRPTLLTHRDRCARYSHLQLGTNRGRGRSWWFWW